MVTFLIVLAIAGFFAGFFLGVMMSYAIIKTQQKTDSTFTFIETESGS